MPALVPGDLAIGEADEATGEFGRYFTIPISKFFYSARVGPYVTSWTATDFAEGVVVRGPEIGVVSRPTLAPLIIPIPGAVGLPFKRLRIFYNSINNALITVGLFKLDYDQATGVKEGVQLGYGIFDGFAGTSDKYLEGIIPLQPVPYDPRDEYYVTVLGTVPTHTDVAIIGAIQFQIGSTIVLPTAGPLMTDDPRISEYIPNGIPAMQKCKIRRPNKEELLDAGLRSSGCSSIRDNGKVRAWYSS